MFPESSIYNIDLVQAVVNCALLYLIQTSSDLSSPLVTVHITSHPIRALQSVSQRPHPTTSPRALISSFTQCGMRLRACCHIALVTSNSVKVPTATGGLFQLPISTGGQLGGQIRGETGLFQSWWQLSVSTSRPRGQRENLRGERTGLDCELPSYTLLQTW